MCGRYHLSTPPEALATIFGFIDLPNLAARWNIAPTQAAPIIRPEASGAYRMDMARWGLVPPWNRMRDANGNHGGPPLINARGETIAEKPAFRTAFRNFRVLVPADGFYEWTGKGADKRAYYIRPQDGRAFAFAGIIAESPKRFDGPSWSFSIVTTTANAALAPIHHRMPVVVPSDAADIWLSGPPAEAAKVIQPASDSFFEAYAVHKRVGNVREAYAGLIKRLQMPDEAFEPPKPDQMSLF